MTSAFPDMALSEAAVDRLRELGSIGAGHAATAFARLVGRTIRMRVPAVRSRAAQAGVPGLDGWETGIFFALEGGPGGDLAVLFSPRSRDALLALLLGRRTNGGTAPDPEAESALREVGNILASSVASAIADTLGTRILPSLPALAFRAAGAEFVSHLVSAGRADALRIETEFFDRDDELRGLVVFVPARED